MSDVESRLIRSMQQAVAIKNGEIEPSASYVVVGDGAQQSTTLTTTEPAPKWHPTLMSGSMVLATLADRKRMTRRVLTDRNSEGNFKPSELDLATSWVDPGLGGGAYLKSYLKPEVAERLGEPPRDSVHRLYCRIQIGDRLWIREALTRSGGYVQYAADHKTTRHLWPEHWQQDPRPSMHMNREYSRITLEVTGVRPERVQDISDDDARAEGVESRIIEDPANPDSAGPSYRMPFADLWDSLNAARGYGWDVNPLVWVIEFKRVS